MNLAIIGSRNFSNLGLVADYVRRLPSDTVVISGGARGVDLTAAVAARSTGLTVREFLPDWERYGKSAGFKRNAQIVEAADRLVAFWDGRSRGTADTISKARDAGLIVTIIRPDGSEETPRSIENDSFDHTDPHDGATRAEYEDARAREIGDDYPAPLSDTAGRPKTKLLTTRLKWICAAKPKTRESRSGRTLNYFTQALFTSLGNRVILTYDAGTHPVKEGPGDSRTVEIYGRDIETRANLDNTKSAFIVGAEVFIRPEPSHNSHGGRGLRPAQSTLPPPNAPAHSPEQAARARRLYELRTEYRHLSRELEYDDTNEFAKRAAIEDLAMRIHRLERSPLGESSDDVTLRALIREQIADQFSTTADDSPSDTDEDDNSDDPCDAADILDADIDGVELERASEPWADASIPVGATVDGDCWDCPARLGAACTRHDSCLMEVRIMEVHA